MKDWGFGKTLILTVGAVLSLTLVIVAALPMIMDATNASNRLAMENAAAYWTSQGYVALADPSGNLAPLAGDNVSDLGTQAASWNDLWVDGVAYLNSANISGYLAPKASGTPDYVVGVNTANDDVTGSTGYWVKSGATGQVVETNADAGVSINWAFANGKSVYLTSGTFNISTPIIFPISQGKTLIGAGSGAEYATYTAQTLLYVVSGSNCNAIQFATPASDAEFANGSILRDFAIDGNNAGNTSGNGIDITYFRAGHIQNVWAFNCAGHGMYRNRPGGAPLYSDDWCTLTDVMCIHNGGTGASLTGIQDGLFIYNSWFNDNVGIGLLVNGAFHGVMEGVSAELNDAEGFSLTAIYEMRMSLRSWDNGSTGCWFSNSFNNIMDYQGITNALTAGDAEIYLADSYRNTMRLETISAAANHVGIKFNGAVHQNVITPNVEVTGAGSTGIYFNGSPTGNKLVISGGSILAPTPVGGNIPAEAKIINNAGYVQGELVSNGGFETNNTGWTANGPIDPPARSNEQAHSGTYSGKVVCDANVWDGAYWVQTAVKRDRHYTASAWVYRPDATTALRLAIHDQTDATIADADVPLATGWQKVTCDFTTAATTTTCSVLIIKQNDATVMNFYIDDVSMAPVTAGMGN